MKGIAKMKNTNLVSNVNESAELFNDKVTNASAAFSTARAPMDRCFYIGSSLFVECKCACNTNFDVNYASGYCQVQRKTASLKSGFATSLSVQMRMFFAHKFAIWMMYMRMQIIESCKISKVIYRAFDANYESWDANSAISSAPLLVFRTHFCAPTPANGTGELLLKLCCDVYAQNTCAECLKCYATTVLPSPSKNLVKIGFPVRFNPVQLYWFNFNGTKPIGSKEAFVVMRKSIVATAIVGTKLGELVTMLIANLELLHALIFKNPFGIVASAFYGILFSSSKLVVSRIYSLYKPTARLFAVCEKGTSRK